jgi:hypothetical protein
LALVAPVSVAQEHPISVIVVVAAAETPTTKRHSRTCLSDTINSFGFGLNSVNSAAQSTPDTDRLDLIRSKRTAGEIRNVEAFFFRSVRLHQLALSGLVLDDGQSFVLFDYIILGSLGILETCPSFELAIQRQPIRHISSAVLYLRLFIRL